MTTELTVGTFRARAITEEWTLSESSKGTPQVLVNFAITTQGYEGASIPSWIYLSEAAFDRGVKTLRVLGWQGDDLAKIDGLDANEVDLVLEEETYEGKTYLKVKWINQPGAVQVAAMEPKKAQGFAAQMRSRIRALDASEGKKPDVGTKKTNAKQSKASSEPPPHSDMDAPPF